MNSRSARNVVLAFAFAFSVGGIAVGWNWWKTTEDTTLLKSIFKYEFSGLRYEGRESKAGVDGSHVVSTWKISTADISALQRACVERVPWSSRAFLKEMAPTRKEDVAGLDTHRSRDMACLLYSGSTDGRICRVLLFEHNLRLACDYS